MAKRFLLFNPAGLFVGTIYHHFRLLSIKDAFRSGLKGLCPQKLRGVTVIKNLHPVGTSSPDSDGSSAGRHRRQKQSRTGGEDRQICLSIQKELTEFDSNFVFTNRAGTYHGSPQLEMSIESLDIAVDAHSGHTQHGRWHDDSGPKAVAQI